MDDLHAQVGVCAAGSTSVTRFSLVEQCPISGKQELLRIRDQFGGVMLTKVPQCGCGDGFKQCLPWQKCSFLSCGKAEKMCTHHASHSTHLYPSSARTKVSSENQVTEFVKVWIPVLNLTFWFWIFKVRSSLVFLLIYIAINMKPQTCYRDILVPWDLMHPCYSLKKVASINSSRHLKTEHPAVKMLDNKYKMTFKSPEFKILNRYRH